MNTFALSRGDRESGRPDVAGLLGSSSTNHPWAKLKLPWGYVLTFSFCPYQLSSVVGTNYFLLLRLFVVIACPQASHLCSLNPSRHHNQRSDNIEDRSPSGSLPLEMHQGNGKSATRAYDGASLARRAGT